MSRTVMIAALLSVAVLAVVGCKGEKASPQATATKDLTQEHGKWVYTVQQGDTWDSISQKVYGEAGMANTIQKANPKVQSLTAGSELAIPMHPKKTGDAAMPKGCSRRDIY